MPKTKNKIDYLAQLEEDMVLVEKGNFMMGSDESASEQPIHRVTFENDFYICKYPVTQGLWKAVMGENNNPSMFKGNDRPVETISWDYINNTFLHSLNKLVVKNYRLPTESEWEYAAKGGNKGNHNLKSSGSSYGKEIGWFDENSNIETKPVGLKKPNELGIFDMNGNVGEWCQDAWRENYIESPILRFGSDMIDEGPDRVLRGGDSRLPFSLNRVTNRSFLSFRNNNNFLGFRLAHD